MKILAVVDIWVAVFVHELPNSFSGRERTMYSHVKYVLGHMEKLRVKGMPPGGLVVHDASQAPFSPQGASWVRFSDLTDIVFEFTYDEDVRKEGHMLMHLTEVDRQEAAISKAQATAAPRVADVTAKRLVEDFAQQQRNDTSQRLSEKHFDQMSAAWSAAVRAKIGAPSVHKSPPRQTPVTLNYSEDDE
jgi:hypothetical protein